MKVQIVCDHSPWKAPEKCELTSDQIGMVCPDCGETVVNQKDFDLFQSLGLFKALGLVQEADENQDPPKGFERITIKSRDFK